MRSVSEILAEQNELRMLRDPLTFPGEPLSSQRLQPRRRRVDAGIAQPERARYPDKRSKGYASRGKPTKATPEKLAQLTVLRAQGLSHRAIAQHLGVSRTAVSDWLARGGQR